MGVYPIPPTRLNQDFNGGKKMEQLNANQAKELLDLSDKLNPEYKGQYEIRNLIFCILMGMGVKVNSDNNELPYDMIYVKDFLCEEPFATYHCDLLVFYLKEVNSLAVPATLLNANFLHSVIEFCKETKGEYPKFFDESGEVAEPTRPLGELINHLFSLCKKFEITIKELETFADYVFDCNESSQLKKWLRENWVNTSND